MVHKLCPEVKNESIVALQAESSNPFTNSLYYYKHNDFDMAFNVANTEKMIIYSSFL